MMSCFFIETCNIEFPLDHVSLFLVSFSNKCKISEKKRLMRQLAGVMRQRQYFVAMSLL